MKKIICVLLAALMCFCIAACSDTKTVSVSGSQSEEFSDEYNRTAEKAVGLLLDEWTKYYDGEQGRNITDRYLEIKNTRIIYLKDNDNEHFSDIEKIVEFMLLDNYTGGKSYYGYSTMYNNVIFYKNGSCEVTRNYFDTVRSSTYNADFSDVVDKTVDLGSEYNEVYNL